MSVSCLRAAILNYCLSFALHIIENSFIVFLDLENMGIAVGNWNCVAKLYTG